MFLKEQLENDLQKIVEQNRQTYEKLDQEYQQLHNDIPQIDYAIVRLRENAVNLWSEINTYRYLLVNLFSTEEKISPIKTQEKSSKQYRDETTGFIVHIEDGVVWVRI